MNITLSYELQLPTCGHFSNCDCDTGSYQLTVHGFEADVAETATEYEPEIVSIDGMPGGMHVSDLDPTTVEDILNWIHSKAEDVRASRAAALSCVKSALRLLRTTDDREMNFRMREAVKALSAVEEVFS